MHCWNGSEDPAPSASRWNRRLHIYNLLMLVEQLTSNNCQYGQAASSSEKWQSNCLRLLGGSWTDDKIHGNPRCIFHEFNNFHSLEVISQVVSPYMTDETVSVEARRAVFRLGLIAATGDSWFVKIQIGHINWGDVHWIIMGSYGIISADWMATELSQSPKIWRQASGYRRMSLDVTTYLKDAMAQVSWKDFTWFHHLMKFPWRVKVSCFSGIFGPKMRNPIATDVLLGMFPASITSASFHMIHGDRFSLGRYYGTFTSTFLTMFEVGKC